MSVCCFTGHRVIPATSRTFIEHQTARAVNQCILAGTETFLCGGAWGFDLLAASVVLRAKTAYPQVRLKMVLPCPEQADRWSAADRAVYHDVLARADETVYVADRYYRGCMQARNRAMIEESDACICYLTATTGGTAYTVNGCRKKGIPIFNVAL